MLSRRGFLICIAVLVVVIILVMLLLPRGTAPAEVVVSSTAFTDDQTVSNSDIPAETFIPTVSLDPTRTVSPITAMEPDSIAFIESNEMKLPTLQENLQYGQPYHLFGTIKADKPLKSVTVTISSKDSDDPIYPYEITVNFDADDQVETYLLEDMGNPDAGDTISNSIPFSSLKPGCHTLTIAASTFTTGPVTPASTEFIVGEPSEWLQLISNNLRGNYVEALDFFGDRSRFLFKYKLSEGRDITIDPEWVKKYIVMMPGLKGKALHIHIDAVPFFKEALHYLDDTYVRVRGNGHDSGVIKLADLVKTSNGTYVPRFVTDKSFISHHAFGTAVDLNANIVPNNNKAENHAVILREVKDCLDYEGVSERDGKKYYDFAYNGNWQEYYRNVPTSVLNYLLYELAFYRAGFGWGYYYRHTCDAMHFTLTERDISEHSMPKTGLKKVYDYIAE
jgi:hypothetical protein